MKSFNFIIVSLLFCATLSAQNVTENTKKEINRIKSSRAYISAEATMPTSEEALNEAEEALIQSIDQWVKEEKNYIGDKQISTQDIKSCIEKLTMNRGKNVRTFIYTLKKDIIPLYGNLIHLEKDEQNENQNVSVVNEKPVTTTAKKESSNTPNKKVKTALQRIVEAQTMDEIKEIFHELKKDSGITYGKMTSADLDVFACCLLFYNREGKVVGVLGEGDQERINLRTNQPERLSNYSGNAAYWFVITKAE